MHVRMRETRKGSPNGIDINTYEAGQVYDLPDRLVSIFLGEGWAERFSPSHEAMPEVPAEQEPKSEPEMDANSEPGDSEDDAVATDEDQEDEAPAQAAQDGASENKMMAGPKENQNVVNRSRRRKG